MAERVQFRRVKGWRMPANTVKVTRPSSYGNPYIVGVDGTRAECVAKFRALVTGENPLGLSLENPGALSRPKPFTFFAGRPGARTSDYHISVALNWIRGKNLACVCPPGEPCHADVLLELANPEIGASALKRQSGRTLSPPTPPVRADAPPLSEPKEGR